MGVIKRIQLRCASFSFLLPQHARGSNRAEEAIVVLKATNASPVFFCAAYLPAVKNLPKKEEDAEYHPFLNALNDTECEYERRSFEGKVVLLDRCANTTNDQLIEQAKSAKAAAIVVSIDAKKVRYEQKHNESALMAKLIATSSSFDGSFFAIWIIAMGTVMTGSYWSGVSQHAATSSTSLVPGGDKHSDFSETIGELEERFSMPLSPIYLIIIMFSLASASALFACLEPIVNRIGVGTSKVPERLAICSPEPLEIRHVALGVFAIGVALTWYFFRNNDVFGWALQDILAIAFCINMLKSIHLPNLRMICLLLSLLLVYDVFFVFITPFLQAVNR
ncbi:hypothetical protein HPB48_022657 [Haemaphysalis longicornis]|uniref:Uncharacterized protein n=1 Tax=Haemaphysalis longicornis TaxID=44386 RepID=A0A9J6GST3_HAELO|nr:hypothetical protein HPB48_022657 [Haemaphysalis longicornis]